MDRCVGAAARLPGGDRKDLAIHALARSETVSGLAARHGVSRKFAYQQTHKGRKACGAKTYGSGLHAMLWVEVDVAANL